MSLKPMILQILSVLLNFCILAFLLWKFLIPKLSELIEKRMVDVNLTLDETEKNLADINSELELVRQEMKTAEEQIAQINTEAEKRGNAAADKIKADTEQEITQMKERVERQISQEFHNLHLRLRKELVDQVMLKAEDLVKQEADKNVHTRVIENFAYTLKDFKEYKS